MKLRIILFILALLAILSTLTGGYFYYSSVQKAAFEESIAEVEGIVYNIADQIEAELNNLGRSVESLSGIPQIQLSLTDSNEVNLKKANSILDQFRSSLKVSVCYLIDREGNTIASSNRNNPDSFVGMNYAFRPYFSDALEGEPRVYMALGVTSRKRGIYYGYPVYGDGSDRPVGVVVIKAFIDDIEKKFRRKFNGIILLTDPHGVVFVSSRKDWLYHTLWKTTDQVLSEIENTKQFGKGPWEWTGLEKIDDARAFDQSGNEYHIYSAGLNTYPGWNVVSLYDHIIISEYISSSLIRGVLPIIVILCSFVIIIAMVLYKAAREDMARRIKAENALRDNEKRFRALAETAGDAIISINSSGGIIYWNSAAENIFGYSAKEVMNKSVMIIMPERYHKAHLEGFRQANQAEELSSTGKTHEITGVKKNGAEFPVEFTVSMWRLGKENYFTAIIRDISARKYAEQVLKELAEIDALTKVYNRRMIFSLLETELNRVKRYDERLSLLMFDIDYFKKVNDTYGHAAGDSVLRTIADMVKGTVRKADMVARYGGEEFLILLSETDIEGAQSIAEKIRTVIGGHQFEKVAGKVTVSIGVTVLKEDDTIDSILKRVDTALYKAKKNGRNRVEFLL